jgi:hypothetical protein
MAVQFDWSKASVADVAGRWAAAPTIYAMDATPDCPTAGEAALVMCCCPCNPSSVLLNWVWGGTANTLAWFFLFPLEAVYHRSK